MEKRPEKLKIMIVQSDEDNMTLYSDYLSKRGYHVIARYTKGDDILTDVEKEPPDVFVLNSKLPGNKSGMEVATEIFTGSSPFGDGELEALDGLPEGFDIPQMPEAPQEYAPGLDKNLKGKTKLRN